MRRRADGRDRVGLLQWQFCGREDGEAQSGHPDRRARGSAILRMPGPSYLQFLRRVPAERSATGDNLADRIRRVPPLRAANGVRARRAAFGAAGLFRWNGGGTQTRLLEPLISTHNDDWHSSFPPRDIHRDLTAIALQPDIGRAVFACNLLYAIPFFWVSCERTGAGGAKPAQESVGVGIRVEVLHHAPPPG